MNKINFVELETERTNLLKEIDAETKRHQDALSNLRNSLIQINTSLNLLTNNLDVERIQRAEKILYVRGLFSKAGDDKQKVLENSIQQILAGGGILFSSYLGTKSYDRWYGQYIDCRYGRCPSHGSVIFEIGFTDSFRKNNHPMNDDEKNDCIYYLRNLNTIQESKQKAA